MLLGNPIESRPMGAAFEPSDRFIAGRDLPPGTLGWHVDCAPNPMDLRPAVETILRALDETRAKGTDGKPLMVLFGEVHSVPAYCHLLPFVANRLHARGEDFVVAQERPFNLWAEATAWGMEPSVPEDLLRQPSYLYDETGRGAVLSALCCVQIGMAPVSTHNELAFFQDKGLKVVFNDVARDRFLLEIDLENPVVARAMQAQPRRNHLHCDGRNSTAPEGIAIRNAVMADLAVDFARRHKVPFILQQTGLTHLFGNETDRRACAYADSLHAMATHRGMEVLAVLPTNHHYKCGLNLLPSGAQRALKDTVVIDGLAEDEFGHEYKDPAMEKAHLCEMLTASGNEIPFYDVGANLEEWRGRAREEAKNILEKYDERQAPRTPRGQKVEKPLAFGP